MPIAEVVDGMETVTTLKQALLVAYTRCDQVRALAVTQQVLEGAPFRSLAPSERADVVSYAEGLHDAAYFLR
jgi:hypothetical protein